MVVTRVIGAVEFPARFTLVAAANPCPCGFAGDPRRRCSCQQNRVDAYRAKLSGPLLDLIDIRLVVPRLSKQDLLGEAPGEASAPIRERVEEARARQRHRYAAIGVPCNARLPGPLARNEVRALERLVASVNAIGMPDIDDGETIRDDIIAGLHASLGAFEQVRDEALSMGEHPSDAEKAALVGLAGSAWRYPTALWALLFQADYSDVRVYLSDPVEEETVARLSEWLLSRPEVVSAARQPTCMTVGGP